MQLKIWLCRQGAVLPKYATPLSAGMDLRAVVEKPVHLPVGQVVKIPTGLCMAIPAGFEGQVRPRSGLAAKHGVTVLNAPGTIDADYRGEVSILLINHGSLEVVIEEGERIAQLVIAPVSRPEVSAVDSEVDLGQTDRGTGGFGSTGRS